MDELKVKVVYRDRDLNPTSEKTYLLRDYTDMLKMDILRAVTDVEDLVYITNGNKPKEEWSDDTWTAFQRIRHKLLDKAGSIGRLPNDIIQTGDEHDGKTAMGD